MALEYFEIEVDERLESANPVVHFVADIIAASGVGGLFRGLPAVAMVAAPAHAISFTAYETVRRLSGATGHGHHSGEHHPFSTALSGIAATVLCILTHDALLTPTDAIKQRLQLNIRPYAGVIDCFKQVIRTEGFAALFAGYTTALTMNVPYSILYYASYESLKTAIRSALRRDPDQHHPLSHLLAGAGAGSLAGALTTPLDVAKTRLQTQGEFDAAQPGGIRYKGMIDALRKVWQQEGMRGLTRGFGARLTFHSMSAALTWTTYEQIKHLMAKVVR